MMVRGIVRDSLTTEGLPYASLTTDDGTTAVADARGIFEFTAPAAARSLRAYSQGYTAKTVALASTPYGLLDINLSPEAQELAEVVVRKQKYSKRNNPAVDFVNRLRLSAHLTDPERHPFYSYDRYERITMGLNRFDPDSASAILRRFNFLAEHVDTSEIDGAPVLTLSVKEAASTVGYRRKPEAHKVQITGLKRNGIDEFTTDDNAGAILQDMMREISLTDDNINILRNTFLSPLSGLAPDFYRFYLVDTLAVEGVPCVSLAFYPRNRSAFGFMGHVYVEAGDTAMAVRKVEMSVPREINLNFVRDLKITQAFDRAPDGTRLKTLDELLMTMRLVPGTPEIYLSRKIALRNHSFEPLDEGFYDRLGTTFTDPDADSRDSLFWQHARQLPEQQGESRSSDLRVRLRSVPLYYWSELILGYLFRGYIATGDPSRFDLGPINTFASYNSLEGLRLRAGGMTTANLSRRWFGRGYVAHGFRDHKWKYGAEVEYSFIDKKYHSREFPMHALRLTQSYDVDRLGSHYLYTNADNFVLSLQRMNNARYSYKRLTRLEYILELNNNFSVVASVENVRQEASRYLRFRTPDGRDFRHYTENIAGIELRYAPGEKFIQTKTTRFPINEEAPVFVLSHHFGPKGMGGSRYAVNKTELSVTKCFPLSILGRFTAMLAGGHVWSRSAFPELLIPNANLSYTIQPYSFALMNPMEFINSSYVQWDFTYEARGALFNLIPGLRRLGLREVVGFRGLFGHLSERNTPGSDNPELFLFPAEAGVVKMGRKPYAELAVGLDNILHFIRLDYVWRLTYRDVPYTIDRRGLRLAVNFTF